MPELRDLVKHDRVGEEEPVRALDLLDHAPEPVLASLDAAGP
jgi:hypothetical protein